MRNKLESYFKEIVASEPGGEQAKKGRLAWRLSCFDTGLQYADYIEKCHFALQGRRVLDVACAWGGHAVAFAAGGARVLASDYLDHRFEALEKFATKNVLVLRVVRADCQSLPIIDGTIDVILALELVEHLAAVEPFAREVARLLRPEGVCVVSTPPRLRSLLEGEPHYRLKGLTVLPLRGQRWVATKLFGRTYPYPITRQYLRASNVLQPFRAHGLIGEAVLRGRLARRLEKTSRVLSIAREVLWSFLVLKKPSTQA